MEPAMKSHNMGLPTIILLLAIWVLLIVVIFHSLEYSTFPRTARAVIACCAATLGVLGGRELLIEVAVPNYAAMSATVLAGVAAIIVSGMKRVQREAKRRSEDDLEE